MPQFPRMRLGRVAIFAALFLGCPKKPDTLPPPLTQVVLSVDGWDAPIELKVGDSRTLGIHVTNADGTAATGYTLYTPNGEGFQLEHLSDGEERLTIKPLRPGHVHPTISAARGPDAPATTPAQDLTFYGGPTDELHLFPRDMVLVVGEVRPVGVFALTRLGEGPATMATLSSDVPTFTSDTPGVVTVDEHGALTAVAVGSAHVTVKAGSQTAMLPVTVAAGTLRTPGDERNAFDPSAQIIGAPKPGVDCSGVGKTASDKLTFDARGWPVLLAPCSVRTTTSTTTTWALLRWTGSGFGAEVLVHPDVVTTNNARVTATDDGLLAVLLIANEKSALLTRALSAPSGPWNRSIVLSRNDWASASTGQQDLAYQTAMLARPGGGVFLARWQPFDPGPSSQMCQRQVVLLSLHDGLVERTHTEFAPTPKLLAAPPCAEARYTANGLVEPLTLLRPPPGSTWPRMFAVYGGAPEPVESWVLDPTPSGYTATRGGAQRVDPVNQGLKPVSTVVARGPGQDTLLTSLGGVPLGDRPEVTWGLMDLIDSIVAEHPMAFTVYGKVYAGGGYVDMLAFASRDPVNGLLRLEALDRTHVGIPAWWAPVLGQTLINQDFQLAAWGQSERTLAFSGRGFLMTRTIPPALTTDGTEATGRPFETFPNSIRDLTVAPDGTRYAVGRDSAPPNDLLNIFTRCSGANQPWQTLVTTTSGSSVGMFWRVFPVGARTFISDDAVPTLWRVLSSDDHLSTATERLTKPLGSPHTDFISADGLAITATLSGHHWVVPHVDAATLPAPLPLDWALPATWTASLSPTSYAVGQTGGIFGYANSSLGGAWQVVAASARGANGLTTQWALAARRIAADGTVAESHLFPFQVADVPLAGTTFREKIPDVGTVVEAPDGALIVQSDARIWRLELPGDTSTSVAKPGDPGPRHQPMPRVGNHLALLSTVAVNERNDVLTQVSWSTDGRTWVTTPFPRGDGMGLVPLTSAADGHALLAIVQPSAAVLSPTTAGVAQRLGEPH